jgi:hypothetical protein
VRLLAAAALCAGSLVGPGAVEAQDPVLSTTLEARALLPADTFAPGPPSGAALGTAPINGRTPPFGGQPVQGFSGVIRTCGRDTYLGLSDNGYGRKENSADFLLRLYRLEADFRRHELVTGTIRVRGDVQLRDPFRHIPFPIVHETTGDRLLTGADFDPESVSRDHEGDLWVGDEFGPYLLHADDRGRLLEPPIPLPGVRSPQNPTLAPGEAPNLGRSHGLEGMARSRDGTKLYPMLERALVEDPEQRRRLIFEFDLGSRSYTGTRLEYRTEAPEHAIGDFTALDADRFVVIERDNRSRAAAAFKKLYVIDLSRRDADGFVPKREVGDLLRIDDPSGISLPGREGDIGLGANFSFPFSTIEAVLPLGRNRVLVLNDNNYPSSASRNANRPDDTEAIVLRAPGLAQP